MSLEQGSAEEAGEYLGFLARFETEEAWMAFVFLHLNFSRFERCHAAVGRHGVMASLRIYDLRGALVQELQAEQTNAELVLADRDIKITLSRVWGYLKFFDKLKLFFFIHYYLSANY